MTEVGGRQRLVVDRGWWWTGLGDRSPRKTERNRTRMPVEVGRKKEMEKIRQ